MAYEANPNELHQDVAVKLLQHKTDGKHSEIPSFWFSKRFFVVFLLFLGYCNAVMLRSTINIAVVKMTYKMNVTENVITTENNITTQTNITTETQPEYNWDSKTTGFVLSVHWYGYMFCAGGGYLATKFGGATLYGISLMSMAILTVLTPFSLYVHYYLFIVCKLILGILDGFAYTASAELLSRWAPVRERSTMMSLVLSGLYIGIAGTYPVGGFLAQRWGWPMIFYATGVVTLIWSTVWLLIVRNQPSKDKRISQKELHYINENIKLTPRKEIKHPYKEIYTSMAVWAICVGKFAYSYGYTILVTCFPLFVADVTHKKTDEVGFIASIPNFACIFMIPICGAIIDYWQNNSDLKPSQIHKIVMTSAFAISSILFAVAALGCNFTLSMICFVLIKLLLSFTFLILQLSSIYMAPQHCSVLAGVSAFWYTVATISLPTLVGFIVTEHELEEWNKCFYLTGGVLMLGAIMYLLYGSSDLQPWARSSASDTNHRMDRENYE